MAGVRPEENQRSDAATRRASALREAAPALITLAAGLICYGLFYNRGLGLSVIGYSIAPAERVMQGEVPYRDFLFNYTPGILWVNALLMKAFGATLMATRVGLFAFKLTTLLALFYAGRRLIGSWGALVPVALTLAWPGYQQVFNVYPDQYLIFFALAGLICMLNYDDRGSAGWLVLSGLATGAVFLFKYNVGVLLLGAGSFVVVARELMMTRGIVASARAVIPYVTGFAVAAAALAGYLVYNNALGAMIGHFLHHAAEYSEARSVGLPPPAEILPAAILLAPAIALGYVLFIAFRRAFQVYLIAVLVIGVVLLLQTDQGKVFNDSVIALVAYLPPLVFVAGGAIAVWQLKKDLRGAASWWSRNGDVLITGIFALAVYLEVFPRADYYHLVRVLPPVFLFLVVLLVRGVPALTEWCGIRQPPPRRAVVLAVSIVFVFVVAAGVKNCWRPEFDSKLHLRDNQELRIERGRGILVEDRQAELTEGLVDLIQANSSKDDYIFSFAQRGSALYFLAARRNPTRFLWWRSVGISREEREGVMAMIASRRATLIIVQDVAANKEIQDFIGDNYHQIGIVTDIAVYGLRNPAAATGSVPGFSRRDSVQARMPALPGAGN